MNREEWVAMLEKVASDLAEHCDSVRIFATTTTYNGDEEQTDDYNTGRGNFLTSLGQVQEFIWTAKRR